MAIASSIFLGAKFIYAVDCIDEILKIAQEFGTTIDFLKCDVVKKIKELTDGRGADVVLEVVGDPTALELAYNVLRPAGILYSVGVHNSATFGKFDFEKIITHELKLSDGEKAYEMFDKK